MKEGGWVFLQNIHLMSLWVKNLERKLEQSQEGSHFDFRCFLSSEPPPLPNQQTIPEAILQNSIKVSNQPAQSLRANLLRAWQSFNQSFLDTCLRKDDFRAILLALCCFHALVNGRRKFGFIGWSCSNIYGFTMGDLAQCAQVAVNMLNARTGARAKESVPYADLKYIFGEIMYGGHITDKWDRRTCVTYLETLVVPEIYNEGHELFIGFKSKVKGSYEDFLNHIDISLPPENPPPRSPVQPSPYSHPRRSCCPSTPQPRGLDHPVFGLRLSSKRARPRVDAGQRKSPSTALYVGPPL